MPSVRSVERSFFPLDEELELLPGSLTPYLHESLVRLGAWMPFKFAAALLEDLQGVAVSKAKATRDTEAAGAAYVALQTEEADELERCAPSAGPGSDKMVLSADGAMVPLVHGAWAEVKTLVIGEVEPPIWKDDAWVVHTGKLSYFSRLVTSMQFEHLTLSEVHRRGVANSRAVAALMDGAEWLQGFVDYHCPEAVRILDFPHAGQRLGQVAQALWGEASAETQQWTHTQLHALKHQGSADVLNTLRELQQQHPDLDLLQENLAYLEKRHAQMDYPAFQQQGWPIGSGIVESGNKLVVEARLKGAGMHWKRENVDPLLALRNLICSDRWAQEWPRIEGRLRQQAAQRRQALRQKHRQAKSPPAPLETPRPPVPTTPARPRPAGQEKTTRQPGRWRPPADHPWRRFRFGRSLYQPSNPAKN